MRQAWMAGVAWVLILFGGAWLLAAGISAAQPGKTDRPTGQTEKADGQDSRSVLRVYDGEKTVEMTMAEYLCGVRCPPPSSRRR